MRTKASVFLSCVVMAASGVAAAQSPPAPAAPPAHIAQSAPTYNCAPTQSTPQGTVVPEGTTTGQGREPLGDQLAKSDGVLCPPPGVDPQMRAPTPDAGNTPVIPPPGSPGGDPTIRPK
jgi:hypothetical protein